ncbi:hypothetical protein AYL99_11025 [Fonsecaea erecta]|uniref:DUF7924 domain-containing protein n=1 Tax=Fonsecaea erecta TaxID=1367422 RepID=A0A178Z4B4_9EURO|nr:hypothetical protein AYL99_11025 [Fonsecaea erecta]OAP54577.1 hypothetical protein AYL99_11025 [Fonsecaea erecta]
MSSPIRSVPDVGNTVHEERHRSAQDEDEDEDATERQRRSRRIQNCNQHRQQNVRVSPKTSRNSPQRQEKQAANQQRAARGGQARSSQRPAVKQYHHCKEKDKGQSTPSPAELGTLKSTKRRRCMETRDGDESNHDKKRPRHGPVQYTTTRTGPDKEDFIENWLDKSCWSRRTSTENELQLLEALVNMPAHKAASVLPSPDNSLESTVSTSKKSEKSAASVTDTDYRQCLGYRNIYINRNDPPAQLMQRAKRIISRSRSSPEIDDAAAQGLIATSRRVQNESKDIIIQQLAPGIIPAINKIPDSRLASNTKQLWFNSVPVPLDVSILTNPLPLPKPKPDLAFGYSETAFTRDQLGTIDLLIDDQFGRSYTTPDQKIRFPFLEIEFKSQAENGTHYVATNQTASAGAITLNGHIDLTQRSFRMGKFDYNEPQYFSLTMDHQLACVNVHWLRAPAKGEEGGQHSFHVEGLSQHLLGDVNGIRAVSRAIKNILDHGADARLRTLCEALDAYRKTVVRNREAANAQKQELEVLPKPQSVRLKRGTILPPDPRERRPRRAQTTRRRGVRDRVDVPVTASAIQLNDDSATSRQAASDLHNVQSDAYSRHSLEDGKRRRLIMPTQKALDNTFADAGRDRKQ